MSTHPTKLQRRLRIFSLALMWIDLVVCLAAIGLISPLNELWAREFPGKDLPAFLSVFVLITPWLFIVPLMELILSGLFKKHNKLTLQHVLAQILNGVLLAFFILSAGIFYASLLTQMGGG